MPVNLVVEHLNKRYNVAAGPLQTLYDVIQDICNRIKPSPDPSGCTLLLKGKPQDLTAPIRLLNLPSGTKLVLALGANTIGGDSILPPPGDEQHETLAKKPGNPSKDKASSSPGTSSGKEVTLEDGMNKLSGKSSEDDARLESSSEGWASLSGIEREFCVYHRDELMQGRDASNWDEPMTDSFYDFTVEDYQRTMAEHKAMVDRQEMGLKTAAMREREEMEKAASLGPVNIRLVYPSGMICQAKFKATDKIKILYEFAASITKGGRAEIVLYTTPPRFELKNEQLSLYQAKLVPAANVYIGSVGGKPNMSNSPYSVVPKDEVICLREAPPNLPSPAQDSTNREPESDPAKPAKGKKKIQLPKWFKLNK